MHVWDSRRKRMEEEGESILCQSWSSSAGGLGHGQSHHIWQLIVSQELPERHCHSEGTQPYYYQNTKWHSERSTESLRVIPVCVCQRHRKKKEEWRGMRRSTCHNAKTWCDLKSEEKNPQQTQNFTSQLKPHLEAKVCVKISFQKLALMTSDLSALIYRPSCRRIRGGLLGEGIWPVRTSCIS